MEKSNYPELVQKIIKTHYSHWYQG